MGDPVDLNELREGASNDDEPWVDQDAVLALLDAYRITREALEHCTDLRGKGRCCHWCDENLDAIAAADALVTPEGNTDD